MCDISTDKAQCNFEDSLCTIRPDDGVLECWGDAVEGLPECPDEGHTSFVSAEDVPWIVGAGTALLALGMTVVRFARNSFAGKPAVEVPKSEAVAEPAAEPAEPVEVSGTRSFARSTGEFVSALLTDPDVSYPGFEAARPGDPFTMFVSGGPDSPERMVNLIERGYDVEFVGFEDGAQCDPDVGGAERIIDVGGIQMTETEALELMGTSETADVEVRKASKVIDPLEAEIRRAVMQHADFSINETELRAATLEIMARHGTDFVEGRKMFPEDRAKAIASVLRDVRQGVTSMEGVESWELASDGTLRFTRGPDFGSFEEARFRAIGRMGVAEFMGVRSAAELLRGYTPLDPRMSDFVIRGGSVVSRGVVGAGGVPDWASRAEAATAKELATEAGDRAIDTRAAGAGAPGTAERERLEKLAMEVKEPTGLSGVRERVEVEVRARAKPRR